MSSSSSSTTTTPSESKVTVDLKALNEALNRLNKKDQESKTPVPLSRSSATSGSGPMGDINVQLAYDFKFTPSTSSALASYVALTAYSDSATSTYWANLFKFYRINSAYIDLDFHEYANMTGISDPIRALGWSYRSTSSSSVPGYTSISDDRTFRLIGWSAAKPVVRFRVSPKLLANVGFSSSPQMGVSVAPPLSKWSVLTQDYCMGFVHVCSQDTFCVGTNGRNIIGRLVLNCTLSNKI